MSIFCCFLYIKTPEMQKVTKKIVDLKKKSCGCGGGGGHFAALSGAPHYKFLVKN